MFERKEAPRERPGNSFWPILKWYLILIPVLFFSFLLPNIVQEAGTEQLGVGIITTIIFQFTNIGFGGVLTVIHPIEQSSSGAAKPILMVLAIHQLLTRNIVGFILALIVWYKLPYKVTPEMITKEEEDQKSLQPKTLYILTGVLVIVTILALILQLTAN